MWNFSDRTVQVRTAIITLVGILAVFGVIFVILLNKSGITNTDSGSGSGTQTAEKSRPETVDVSPFIPVNTISPMIKPCLFVLLNSCAETVGASIAVDPNPVVDPTKNTGDEQKAVDDVYATIHMGSNPGLASYSAPIDKNMVAAYFPEYKQTASTSALTVPSGIVVGRVAAKFDINQRVLLGLMAVVNRGGGPLFSSSNDYTTPYFAKDPGFLKQLVAVATDLEATKTKYVLMQSDQKKLPTAVTFFGKQYTVDPKTNAESLAIADFLSRNISDKKDFERAIYFPQSPDTSGIPISQNFILLYQTMYKINPY